VTIISWLRGKVLRISGDVSEPAAQKLAMQEKERDRVWTHRYSPGFNNIPLVNDPDTKGRAVAAGPMGWCPMMVGPVELVDVHE
jgi:hypothetical protein